MGNTLKTPWDRVTIAGLAAGASGTHATRRFISDCTERFGWNGEDPRQLTFAEFNRLAMFFGAQLMTLGITPGQRVLLLLPNMVELAIAVVGARVAGMVPAIAPIEESVDALRGAAERIGASAIVTTGRCEDLRLAERARQIAARLIDIRCVVGFGFGLPDGVIPLDGWAEDEALPLAAPVPVKQEADAIITFARVDGALAAFLRSEAQIVADALAFAARARLGREAGVIATLQPGSAAALVTGLVAPLFLGMPVQLLGPYRRSRLDGAVGKAPEAAIVAPVAITTEIASHPAFSTLSAIISLRRPGDAVGALISAQSEISLLDLDEAGLVTLGAWPAEGIAALEGVHDHPMDDILPENVRHLLLRATGEGLAVAGGFGEPRVIVRDSRLSPPNAA